MDTHSDSPCPSQPPSARAEKLLSSALHSIEQAYELLPDSAPSADVSAADAPQHAEALLEAVATAEHLRSLVDATQMRASVAFRASRREQHTREGRSREAIGKGVTQELALARRSSPARTGYQLAVDRVLVESMPQTMEQLAHGKIAKWSAEETAKAVICLDDEQRATVDAEIAPQLPAVSPRRAGGLARARADELDQEAALARGRREVSQRHVSIRAVSDAMVRVSALLPLVEGVATYKALDDAASTARASGVEGTRGQHMADALFQRITGYARPEDVTVEIQLLMTDETLLGESEDAAWIEGHAVPGTIARRFALTDGPRGTSTGIADTGAGASEGEADTATATAGMVEADTDTDTDTDTDEDRPSGAVAAVDPAPTTCGEDPAQRFIRRLFTDPVSGQLRDADARRRRFTGHDRRFIEIADQTCRTPWCDAPIRHIDHVRRFADGGSTEIGNGAGRCEACNYLMELPDWTARMTGPPPGGPPGSEADRTLELTTPSGRSFTSSAPPLRRVPRKSLGDASRPVASLRDSVQTGQAPELEHLRALMDADERERNDPHEVDVEALEDPMTDAMFEEMLAYFAKHPEESPLFELMG